ncbi:hypothetical protein Ppa06_47470 [Planomonospora parontospora subsp. parontospora]|uniref:Uncharacterized protein n=2 Tax=Planomonospora parontospora TaxID=58119 RepID=A0AA37F667_9ACTN|nr:hypothetical protein [Planomonospora parontospora]GGK82371.1 hypothetical protein GCM10010126_47140 [Planomonospora parontospora]GII10949.1 hypothetical protein Ppa06_47470 [Planomonospora parontospora subsp. parontospora]
MKPTRKTWVSAGVVAVVLTGGVSVAAAASAGGAGRAGGPVPAIEPNEPVPAGSAPPAAPVPPASPEPTGPVEDFVVSEEVNPEPEKVARYWTEHRMEEARPMPMPVVEGPLGGPAEGPVEGPAGPAG